ncbi:hypothetical protein BKK49_01525 [Rodentibacter rarus]|uniref:Uncharacterized protein n=1 Tax=Rodentibacter rarus TaxID=1908260 RepID=A0A1V3INF1_9PAST|nr:hypothetical protein BKK49_01525 [Rodentibacter rarus]OOF43519.1 hypothetical protein BKK50_04835 [Rodentibacter rarus]
MINACIASPLKIFKNLTALIVAQNIYEICEKDHDLNDVGRLFNQSLNIYKNNISIQITYQFYLIKWLYSLLLLCIIATLEAK